jgi:hypothetical protein
MSVIDLITSAECYCSMIYSIGTCLICLQQNTINKLRTRHEECKMEHQDIRSSLAELGWLRAQNAHLTEKLKHLRWGYDALHQRSGKLFRRYRRRNNGVPWTGEGSEADADEWKDVEEENDNLPDDHDDDGDDDNAGDQNPSSQQPVEEESGDEDVLPSDNEGDAAVDADADDSDVNTAPSHKRRPSAMDSSSLQSETSGASSPPPSKRRRVSLPRQITRSTRAADHDDADLQAAIAASLSDNRSTTSASRLSTPSPSASLPSPVDKSTTSASQAPSPSSPKGSTIGAVRPRPPKANISKSADSGTQGGWSPAEQERLRRAIVSRRGLETATQQRPIYDVLLWKHAAEAVGTRNWTACKNQWNRWGREASGFDERKRKSSQLATSQQ